VSLPPFERDWDEDVVRIVCIRWGGREGGREGGKEGG
jgi:hypothetical protein